MQINDDELLELISQTTWTFAKTYANTFPHEYIKRTDYPDLFELMKQAIVTRGYDAKFFKATYRYFHIGGYKYWGPPKYTLILNREKLPEPQPEQNAKAVALLDQWAAEDAAEPENEQESDVPI